MLKPFKRALTRSFIMLLLEIKRKTVDPIIFDWLGLSQHDLLNPGTKYLFSAINYINFGVLIIC